MTHKSSRRIFFAGMSLIALGIFVVISEGAAKPGVKKEDAAAAEKAKAMQQLYANDLGPDVLPAQTLAAYEKAKGKDFMKGYEILTAKGSKCQACHTASRPLNSQFVEPEGKDLAARNAAIEAWKKSDPDLFQDKNIWQPEADIWQRYVKRMMSKVGCNITSEEGKKIWAFLAYDSAQRKTGANKESWRKHRQQLLDQFKKEHPERYEELYGGKEAKKEAAEKKAKPASKK